MKELVKEKGVEQEFFIASAATSTEEIGRPIYPPVRKILDNLGINYSGKTAIQVKRNDYEKYDYIVCMEKYNLRNLARIIGEDSEGKVSLLLDFTDYPRDVADPWYTGDFNTTLKDVTAGCKGLLQYILKPKS